MLPQVHAGQVTPSDALVLRTEVRSDWLQFRDVDPSLPSVLLPKDWPLQRAHDVAYAIYDGLSTAAEGRFRQIVARFDPSLASSVSSFRSDSG